MELKESLEHLSDAVTKIYQTVRSDNKTPLKSLFALNEITEYFPKGDDFPNFVVFADINKFKNINTKFGYSNGDLAIEKVGELIHQHFVETLKVEAFHISGDEFLFLIKTNVLSEFKDKCQHFENCEVVIREDEKQSRFTVGVSFGIAEIDEYSEFQKIKSRAETACKKAKILGAGKFVEWNLEVEKTSLKELRVDCSKCEVAIEISFPKSFDESELKIFCPICSEKMKNF